MREDPPPLIRCPSCGSILTSPLADPEMWECHYHLCRAVFPAYAFREISRMPLVAEKDPPYVAERQKNRSKSL